MLQDGQKVTRHPKHVLVSKRQIYYPWESEPEEFFCCGNYEDVCSRQLYCSKVVDFFDNEQRHPRKQTRIVRDDMVIIDPDYGIPSEEQIAWVLGSKGEWVIVYKGGSLTKQYNKKRLLKLRRSELLNDITQQYKEDALRNDIELPPRIIGPRRSNKMQVLYITKERTIGCIDLPTPPTSTTQPSPGMNRDSALGGEGRKK